IQNLRNGQLAYTQQGDFRATDWTSPQGQPLLDTLRIFCPPDTSQGYPSIYHACGNGGGLHMLHGDSHFNVSAPNEPLEVLVRDAPIPQSCDDVFNSDPTAIDGEYFVGGGYTFCSQQVATQDVGDGRDGDVTFIGNANINVDHSNSRTCADG